MKDFKQKLLIIFTSLFLALNINTLNAQRKMEHLGRGSVALRSDASHVFVSWRIMAEELNNGTTYNLYRNGSLIASNLTVSNYSDENNQNSLYSIAAVVNGVEQDQSPLVSTNSSQVISIPLQNLGDYYVHLAWVGDMDGDGEFEYVVDRIPNTAGASCKVEAYEIDGTRLWQIDLGPLSIDRDNIEGGAATISNGMWDGVTVFDLDMDGKSEVIIKSANGTIFGDGSTFSYSNDIQNFLSVVDGQSGAELSSIALPDDYLSDGPLQAQLNIAYLDGINPSVVVKAKNRIGSGDFNMVISAYDYNGALSTRWKWLRGNANCPEFHQQRIADVDLDGKDEICDGGFVLDDDGSILYSLGTQSIVHGDRFHIGDFDPDRPGLEGYAIQQDNPTGLAWYYYDAKDGTLLQTQYLPHIGDYGRGNVADLDPEHEGYEMWTFTDGIYNVQDRRITDVIPGSYPNFRIWWDGDVQSEMLDGLKFNNWNYHGDYEERVLTASSYGATTSWRNVPVFYGDIIGDWREEVIYEKSDRSALLIFNSVTPTLERIYTLLQNPEYRLCLATKGYYQSAQLDYFLGYNMTTPPTPFIQMANEKWTGSESLNWNETDSNWEIKGSNGVYTAGDSVMFGLIDESLAIVNVNTKVEPAITYVISSVDYLFTGGGELSGDGDLIKTGYSTLTLDISCTYTGDTKIEQGILIVNDTLTQSDVILYGGATLAGEGTIEGNCTLEKRSFVSPGSVSTPGTLCFKQNLNINKDVTLKFDVTDDSTNILEPGDKIIVDADLTIEEGVIFEIVEFNDEIYPGTYPLVNYTGNFSGDLSLITVEGLFGRKFTLIDSLKIIYLKIPPIRKSATITWDGSSNIWDLQNTNNWQLNNGSTEFVKGDSILFNSLGTMQSTVTLDGELPIGRMTINGDDVDYRFDGDGVIGGSGDIIKNDNGTLQLLSTANTYTGKTVINGGTLVAKELNLAGEPSSIGANPSSSPDQFIINNATFSYRSFADTYTNKGIMLEGMRDTIEVNSTSATVSISGVLSGSGQLVKKGTGTLYLLQKNNNYSGGTILNGGSIQLNDPGSSLNVESLGTGTLTFKGGTLIMGDTRDYTNFNQNIFIGEGYNGTLVTDQRCTFNGALTGAGTLNLELPGTIDRTIFNGNWSAFSGLIKANGNSFRLRSSAGYENATFYLHSGLSMYFDTGTSSGSSTAQTVRIGSLSGEFGSSIRDENWIIGENNDSTIFSGLIAGNSVRKEGEGTLILDSDNTYAGGTHVNNGILYINNTTGSGTGTGQVNVNSGGLLGGVGSINGPVVVQSGGVLLPGEAGDFASLTINNTLTFQAGSVFRVETYNAYGESDTVSTGDNQLTLNGILEIDELSSFPFRVGNEFMIIDGTNITGQFEGFSPPVPGENMIWDTSKLQTEGKIIVAASVSIEDVLAKEITIYPVPVKSTLFIEYPNNILIERILIKDLSGKVLRCKTQTSSEIDFSPMPSGIYFIEIVTSQGRANRKIVKL